ncbi:hypothetical protein AAH991_14315 [Microbispora sp. ZYX-F-249]|uniref:Uncharacterized protein n=1 Tax=Microbispora maris TaxID=3144104 RepID=A0ABV0ALX3_9ACTN
MLVADTLSAKVAEETGIDAGQVHAALSRGPAATDSRLRGLISEITCTFHRAHRGDTNIDAVLQCQYRDGSTVKAELRLHRDYLPPEIRADFWNTGGTEVIRNWPL